MKLAAERAAQGLPPFAAASSACLSEPGAANVMPPVVLARLEVQRWLSEAGPEDVPEHVVTRFLQLLGRPDGARRLALAGAKILETGDAAQCRRLKQLLDVGMPSTRRVDDVAATHEFALRVVHARVRGSEAYERDLQCAFAACGASPWLVASRVGLRLLKSVAPNLCHDLGAMVARDPAIEERLGRWLDAETPANFGGRSFKSDARMRALARVLDGYLSVRGVDVPHPVRDALVGCRHHRVVGLDHKGFCDRFADLSEEAQRALRLLEQTQAFAEIEHALKVLNDPIVAALDANTPRTDGRNRVYNRKFFWSNYDQRIDSWALWVEPSIVSAKARRNLDFDSAVRLGRFPGIVRPAVLVIKCRHVLVFDEFESDNSLRVVRTPAGTHEFGGVQRMTDVVAESLWRESRLLARKKTGRWQPDMERALYQAGVRPNDGLSNFVVGPKQAHPYKPLHGLV